MPICKTCNKFSSTDTDECLKCAGSDPSFWRAISSRRRLRLWVFYGVGFAIIMAISVAITLTIFY
jgi:hypothetical protein